MTTENTVSGGAGPGRRFWILLACLVTAPIALYVYVFFAVMVPPSGVTSGRMAQNAWRIRSYVIDNGSYPSSLDELPDTENQKDLVDAWGREIGYRVNADSTITFHSYGADGEPGGAGEDGDIYRTYDFHRYMEPPRPRDSGT